MTSPLVCVVVLSWNRKADTLVCLESLLNQTYPNTQVVLVDNGSVDDSVIAARSAFPSITIIENSTNLGYARGNNIGIQYALDHSASYVLALNNDTVVDPGLVENLLQVAVSDPQIAAVGPKILFHADLTLLWSAGGRISYSETISRMRGFRQRDRGQFDRQEDVDCLPGCAILMRREVLEQIGLFDPVFSPAYFEDTDWCMRARKCGYRLVYAPDAKMWHKVSLSSGGEYNARERYWLAYHSVTFMRRYGQPVQWIKFLLYAFGSWPFVFSFRLVRGQGKAAFAKLVGLLDGLCGLHREAFSMD
jgi:GT2 family glycosyltransferase